MGDLPDLFGNEFGEDMICNEGRKGLVGSNHLDNGSNKDEGDSRKIGNARHGVGKYVGSENRGHRETYADSYSSSVAGSSRNGKGLPSIVNFKGAPS